MRSIWPLYLAGAATVAVVAFVVVTETPEQRQKAYYQAHGAAPPSSELMSRAVNNCDQLAKEIEDMGQVTAEIRKVLRDMEYLTCALPNARPKQTLTLPPPPDCGEGNTAVMVATSPSGVPLWICQDQWGHSHDIPPGRQP